MSAKPVELPRWANVSGVLVDPSSGKKDVGWGSGERPPGQILNWWQKLVYDWCHYLSDGAMSGAFTFDSTVQATTGFIGDSGGPALAPQGVLATALKFSTSVALKVPTSEALDIAGTHTRAFDHFIVAASANPIYFPIPLRTGDHITGFTLYVKKNTDGSSHIQAEIVSSDGATGVVITESATTVNDHTNAPGYEVLALGVSVDIVTGKQYFLKYTNVDASVTPAADLVYYPEILYRRT